MCKVWDKMDSVRKKVEVRPVKIEIPWDTFESS